MTQWAQSDQKYPEGPYTFKFEKEPEFRTESYFSKKKQTRLPMKIVILTLLATSDEQEFPFEERIPVWDNRYADLLRALGIEHLVRDGADVEVVGQTFEADIKYSEDPRRPGRSWPHIANIKIPERGEETPGGDGETPF
jgi:hypothetical protein